MLRRFSVSVGSRLISAVAQAVFLFVLARALGPTNMGLFSIALGTCAFILGLLDWGMTTRALRLAHDPDAPAYLGLTFIVRVSASIVVPMGAAVAAAATQPDISTGWVLLAGALFALGESSGELANALWQGRLSAGRAAGWTIGRRLTALAPLVFGIAPITALLGASLSGLIGSITLAVAIKRHRSTPMRTREFLRRNAPLAVTALGPQISQLDGSVVGLTAGAASAGLYSVAARLNAPLNIIIGTLVQVFVPVLVRQESHQARLRLFVRTRWIVLALASVVAAGAIFAPQLTVLFFGPAYAEASPIVAGVFIGSALSGVSQFHLAWFYGTEMPRRVPQLMIGWSVISLLLVAGVGVVFGTAELGAAYVASQAILSLGLWIIWRANRSGSENPTGTNGT
ncbi:lipopolysaccharide biosynthesis protein [Microbacterium binotii]|uniref:lipopolysaccharide biosynthesis protein n=1 Tax=Microbacterium binotii TaxID=462710 RepID=UPI001F48AEF1|nr:lipopolysaccharide biosynthesis protein [Microbacterium binotii]UIN31107.1 lipopolysaccharide biosynthesis protein [Microbacterium binotii]